MTERRRLIAKADAVEMLRRARFSEETIQALQSRLDDPIDTERDATVLAQHGVTIDELISRMGGSPRAEGLVRQSDDPFHGQDARQGEASYPSIVANSIVGRPRPPGAKRSRGWFQRT